MFLPFHGVGGMLGTIFCAWLMSSNRGGVGFDEGLNNVGSFKNSIILCHCSICLDVNIHVYNTKNNINVHKFESRC